MKNRQTGEGGSRILLDQDIREPLFLYLERKYGKLRFLEELRIGGARADIVMVLEDGLVGIEIKSDADSYTRLPGQVKNYDRYFDRNCIVIGSTHAHHAADHVPPWWGILSVESLNGKVDFYTIREALPNPKEVLRTQLSLLWKKELISIEKKNGLPLYRGKSKSFISKKLMEGVPRDILKKEVLEEFMERDYTFFDDQDEETGDIETVRHTYE